MDDIEYFVMGSDIQTKCLEENIFNFLLQLIDNRHFEFIIHDNIYPPGNPLINYERCKKLIKWHLQYISQKEHKNITSEFDL